MTGADAAPLRVLVYGTLLHGEANHHCLQGARFLGEAETPARYTLYDLGPFPAVCRGGTTAVRGEVYAVDGAILQVLDRLEGYPDFYRRERIVTPFGPAWLYFLPEPPEAPVISGGDWRRRLV